MRARARRWDQRPYGAPAGHALAPDQGAFTESATATSQDELLDRHLDQLGPTQIDVPEWLLGRRDRGLSRSRMRGRRRSRKQPALTLGRTRHSLIVHQARLRRATAATQESGSSVRVHQMGRVLFFEYVCAQTRQLDRWRRGFRTAIGEGAIEAHEVTAVTTQDTLLACLLAVRHMTPAAAVAVDLVQSTHRGPGSIPPACEPARASGRVFFQR